jgi:hypothetical protein
MGVLHTLADGHTSSVSHSMAQKIINECQCGAARLQWGQAPLEVGVKRASVGVKRR